MKYKYNDVHILWIKPLIYTFNPLMHTLKPQNNGQQYGGW